MAVPFACYTKELKKLPDLLQGAFLKDPKKALKTHKYSIKISW